MAPQCNKDWAKYCSLLCPLALQKQVDPLTDNGPSPQFSARSTLLRLGRRAVGCPLHTQLHATCWGKPAAWSKAQHEGHSVLFIPGSCQAGKQLFWFLTRGDNGVKAAREHKSSVTLQALSSLQICFKSWQKEQTHF